MVTIYVLNDQQLSCSENMRNNALFLLPLLVPLCSPSAAGGKDYQGGREDTRKVSRGTCPARLFSRSGLEVSKSV